MSEPGGAPKLGTLISWGHASAQSFERAKREEGVPRVGQKPRENNFANGILAGNFKNLSSSSGMVPGKEESF